MKITTEPLEDCQLSLTIEIDEERFRKAKRQVARHVSREVNIPGFRKGKAPYSAIAQRFGREVMEREMVDFLGEKVYKEALEQEDITPYGAATLDETEFDPLTFRFTVPLPPQVTLGDYRDYRMEFPSLEVSEEEIKRELERLREQNAILAPLDGPAALGDVIQADIVGRTIEGETVLEQDDMRVLLGPEDEILPGFAKAVEGVGEGERRIFTLTIPDDFWQEDWQGVDIECTVDVIGVYESILPELDDDLARTVGNLDSLEELKQDIRRRLQESKRANAEAEYAEKTVKEIIDQAKIKYPPVVFEKTVDDAVENYEQAVKDQEHLALEDYLRIQGKTMEELREELEPSARASLERALVFGEVIRQEGIEVSDEEVETEIGRIIDALGEQGARIREAFSTTEGKGNIRSRLLGNKVTERLVAIAKGETPEIAFAEEVEGPEELEELDAQEEEDIT